MHILIYVCTMNICVYIYIYRYVHLIHMYIDILMADTHLYLHAVNHVCSLHGPRKSTLRAVEFELVDTSMLDNF